MVRQRQFFARRREDAQRRAQVVSSLDAFRRPEPRIESPRRQPPDNPIQASADFLLLANPSALDSIRRPKRPRMDHPRRQRVPHDSVVRLDPTYSVPETRQPLPMPGNDIRIFDAEQEKTARFRERTLPDSFLNSQLTTRIPNKRPSSKELTRKTRPSTPPSLRNWLKPLDHRASNQRAHGHDFAAPDMLQSSTMDQNIIPSIRASPDEVNRSIPSPPTSNREVEIKSPNLAQDPNVLRQKDPLDFSVSRSPEVRKEGALSSLAPQSSEPLPVWSSIAPRFPPVAIDSDSSGSLVPHSTCDDRPRDLCRSLLAEDPITVEHFSAELNALENKLVICPDQAGKKFSFATNSLAASREKERRLPLQDHNIGNRESNLDSISIGERISVPTFMPHENDSGSRQDLGPPRSSSLVTEGHLKLDANFVTPGRHEGEHAAPDASNHDHVEIMLVANRQNPFVSTATGEASDATLNIIQK